MKPTNIPWIGDIPEHWGIGALGYLLRKIGSGKTPRGGAETYVADGVIFLRSQNVYFDGLRLVNVAKIAPEVDETMLSSRLADGDVLLNITGASIGRTTVVPSNSRRMNVNQHVAILRPLRSENAHWIQLWLRSQAGQTAIFLSQGGAARDGLSSDAISALTIALPPARERHEIAAMVEQTITRTQTLELLLTTQLTLLAEYREALITAAVTGEIDVDTFDTSRTMEETTA